MMQIVEILLPGRRSCLYWSTSQYHCCWWPGDASSQGISSYGFDLVLTKCSDLGSGKVGLSLSHTRVTHVLILGQHSRSNDCPVINYAWCRKHSGFHTYLLSSLWLFHSWFSGVTDNELSESGIYLKINTIAKQFASAIIIPPYKFDNDLYLYSCCADFFSENVWCIFYAFSTLRWHT